MDDRQTDTELAWAPRECTLPTAERPLRVAEFNGLFADSLRDLRRPGPTTLRLTLDGTADVAATVADLVEREARCCSFFTFALGRDPDDRLLLGVEVPATRVDVLDGLHARAAMVARTWAAGTPGAPG